LSANVAIKGDKKGHHDFVIAGFFGMFEEMLYDRLMAGATQWLPNVSEQLLACPGTRIFFPAIGKSSESFGLIGFADRFEKRGIFCGEVFLCQHHLTAVRLGRSHDCEIGNENAQIAASRKRI
jgi:hypothetical protein